MVWYIVKCMYNLQNFVILSEVLSFYCSKHSICLISNNSSSSWWFIGKESAYQYRRCRFDPWVKKISWRRQWKPIPIFLPGKFHGQRSLVGYSPWGRKKLDPFFTLLLHTQKRKLRSDLRDMGSIPR